MNQTTSSVNQFSMESPKFFDPVPPICFKYVRENKIEKDSDENGSKSYIVTQDPFPCVMRS